MYCLYSSWIFVKSFLFFPSLPGSQLSFLLVLSTQLQKWYQMHKEYTARFWLHYTKQKPDLWGEKGQDKRWRYLHGHHVDFQPCVSDVHKSLERNWGKFRLRWHFRITRIHREKYWFSVVTLGLQWCSWVVNPATYCYIKAAGCNYLHHKVCLLLF